MNTKEKLSKGSIEIIKSNTVKPNKIPYILNKEKSYLANRRYIDEAEYHIETIHRSYDGKISLCITSNEEEFRAWSQYNFTVEELLEIAWKMLGEKDVYISANGFWNNRRRLQDLRHLKAFVIDLDYYKEDKYKNLSQEEMYQLLLKKEKKFFSDIGQPSLVIDSGQGLYLIWLIESAPHMALSLWQLCMNELYKRFEGYGADPRAKDASHVYRLSGSKNSKNNSRVRIINFDKNKDIIAYTLEHFRVKLLPNNFEKYIPKKERDNLKDKNGKLKKKSKKEIKARQVSALYTTHNLHHRRILDIKRLVELREGDMEGVREQTLFYYRYWVCCFKHDTIKSLEDTLELNNTFKTPLAEKEVISATASAEEYYIHWKETFDKFCEIELKEGVKKTQRQMNNFFFREKCFIFTSEKVIDDLKITQEEMDGMLTLFNTKEKNKRSKEYRNEWKKEKQKENARNEEGRTTREQEKYEKMIIIAEMLELGYKQKEIAERAGCHKSVVSRYIKELKNGDYTLDKYTDDCISTTEKINILA